MTFSLIICTHMRAESLLKLLDSVKEQFLYPNEILIIDGSTNNFTEEALTKKVFKNLKYFKVDNENRGLTKQRNFGLAHINHSSEVVCFLDDDTILENNYFSELIKTYTSYPDALAVGGYITNEVKWIKKNKIKSLKYKFEYDGWIREEPLRFRIRKLFGLLPDTRPCFLPTFSHGRSVSFLPPSGRTYKVEQIMGGVASYRKEVFKTLSFSKYFEGYGLYEDTDFSLRLAKIGTLYVNTKARLSHHHHVSGRPNKYKYGKMVLRNGWYVWKVKYPNPNIISIIKWNATAILLMISTFTGIFKGPNKSESLKEGLGRLVGWSSLIFNKPKIEE